MENVGVVSWVEAQRKIYFRLAGHMARYTDGRWTSTVERWTPEGGRAQGGTGKGRRHARPFRRWSDPLVEFFACVGEADWRVVAHDRARWHGFEQAFVHIVVG